MSTKLLSSMQEQNATWVPVERPAELNDLVAMAVEEKDGDEVLAEHDSVEYELAQPDEEEKEEEAATEAGEDEEEERTPVPPPFEPDLTTPLLGLSTGDEKSFMIDYPEDYGE